METTSDGILTTWHYTWEHHINTDQSRSRGEDDLEFMNNKNKRYVNTKPEFGMSGCLDAFSNVLDGFIISTNHANMPVRSVQARKRYLDTSHQSEPSSKPHERVSSENTFPLSTAPSQQSPSCTNSRSNRHMPLPTRSLYRNNHHQQHFPYQHNNNTSIINSSYYKYYCDYFKKIARRFSAKRLTRILPKWAKNFLSFLLVFQLVGTSMLTSALPLPKKKQSTDIKGMNYLTTFGYVSGPSQEAENLMSESVKTESIKRFQMFADLPVTGIFDHRTMEMMEKPRCGNSDKPALSDWDTGRKKRYILSESRWTRTNLTFRFLNYTPDINFPKIRKAIYDAFQAWSRVTRLTFTEIMFDSNNGKDADIRIQFAQRYHNDGYPFDGEGIILAHAFFPGENKGGDTHFDDDEHWTVDSDEGVNLFMVAAHEFGHALGLSHSKTPGSLMYPWYQGKQSKGYQLPQDDVNGIQKLYGVKTDNETIDIIVKETIEKESSETTDDEKDVEDPHGNCTHTFDAITKIRGDVYIFKGKYFWRWTSGGLRDSKPIPISHFWYHFPEESIDAVFERKRDSKIMFFKGDKYWLYDANHMERGWPLEGRPLVELGLPSDLKKIDAAFTWGFNKRTYLVCNDMYWKFDEMESYMVYDYPRAMTIWQGVPTPLDAAFQFTDNKTYFIKGKYYWEYDDQKMSVKNTNPTGNIAERWMQCPSAQKAAPSNTRSEGHQKSAANVSTPLLLVIGLLTRRLMA